MKYTPTNLRKAADKFREEARTLKDADMAEVSGRLAKALDDLADARERRGLR